MRIRSPGPDGDPNPDDDRSPGDRSARDRRPSEEADEADEYQEHREHREPVTEVSFTVPTSVMALKFGLAALIALIALLAGDRTQLVIGLVAAIGLAAYAARDVVARERLRADADGIVAVQGFAGRRHLPWSEVQRVRVWRPSTGIRAGLGPSSETLEIDAAEEIFLFRRVDLGVDPPDALAALDEVRGVRPA